jgi:hypothetical protein
MSTVLADDVHIAGRAAAGSYLTDGVTLRSWLLTTDHKRIALLYLGSITVFFFIGGAAAAAGATQSDRAARAAGIRGKLQPPVYHAWRDHGVVLPGAGGPGDAWVISSFP